MDKYDNLRAQRIGFIGFGDIAQKAVDSLFASPLHQGTGDAAKVLAFRRQPEKLNAQSPQLQALYADVTKPETLSVLADATVDYWVITLTPEAMTEAGYQATYVKGLMHILQALKGKQYKKLFWVSSSSVYGQAHDEWVDETSATEPQRFSGQVQLAAEALLADEARACVVRFSGIYRAEKHRMLDKLKQGQLPSGCEEDYYTNRIHVVDAARSLLHLMHLDAAGTPIEPLYLASDSSPVKYLSLIQWLSDARQLPLNTHLPAVKKRINSKRCSNARLKQSGFEFTYDTYQAGFSSYQ